MENETALFEEASDEVVESVTNQIETLRNDVVDSDTFWNVTADNILGVLNEFKQNTDISSYNEKYRQLRKEYVMGERAGVFSEDSSIHDEVENLGMVLETLDEINEQVGELTKVVPAVRNDLDEISDGVQDNEDDGGVDEETESSEESDVTDEESNDIDDESDDDIVVTADREELGIDEEDVEVFDAE